ncbi:hypothetical protein [Salimicrobium flavidum]|uniref:hypothetical protein n=1 Tax=Salimicrobium flavidum TaxID=570947 RepID=UPI0013563A82|nr:hypothetical protein [Salimicrobium flavidum]
MATLKINIQVEVCRGHGGNFPPFAAVDSGDFPFMLFLQASSTLRSKINNQL